jgi:amidophosphoribosyltransferase
MCGIIGISNHPEAAKIAFLGLYALQHRGEEAAGIASYNNKDIHIAKSLGLVSDAIDKAALATLKGKTAIGHCRYSTTGSTNLKNIQPFLVVHKNSPMAIAHNGNLTNTETLYKRLEDEGSIFQTTMDSEVIIHLLAKASNGELKKKLISVLMNLEGSFSLIFLIEDVLVGARDNLGFRPLCLGKLDQGYVLASESCALDIINAKFIREVDPGEIVIIKGNKLESLRLPELSPPKKAHCIFENIYFARPDSHIFEDNVYQVRKRLGEKLAQEHPVKNADFVMPIPDSGVYAAIGYAQKLNIPFEVGMIRNHYIGRTFIQPTQFIRDFRVRIKLNPIHDVLKGKRVVVVEDSIVRGTTSRSRIEELRRAGAKEIHMRISCPPIISPCFYGIDFPSKEELIAANKTISEIADFIKVDSLKYLSWEGMLSVMKNPQKFCSACFTGHYPTHVPMNKSKYLMEGKRVRH